MKPTDICLGLLELLVSLSPYTCETYIIYDLSSLEISENVNIIGWNALSGLSGVTSIKVAEGNTIYDSRDNCNAIVDTKTNTLVIGCSSTTIPDSVNYI